MISWILGTLLYTWSAPATAADCEIIRTPLPQTAWQNVQIRAANGNELTLLTGKSIPKQLRDDIETSLADPSMSFRDVANRANRILAQNQDILADHAALLLLVHDQLKRELVNNIYVDIPEDIELYEERARKMYLEAFQMQLRAAPSDISLDRMILLAIGPAFYVRVAEPNLFAKVDMANMPNGQAQMQVGQRQQQQAPTQLPPAQPQAKSAPVADSERSPIPAPNASLATPPPSPPVAEKPAAKKTERSANREMEADDAFQALEEKFSKNRGTMGTIRKIRREIQSGKWDRLSADDAQEKAAAQVWAQARRPVRTWVELEMKLRKSEHRSEAEMPEEFSSRRRRRSEDSEKAKPSPSKAGSSLSAQEIREFAGTLLKREGKAIGFLRAEWYERLVKEYESMCAKK